MDKNNTNSNTSNNDQQSSTGGSSESQNEQPLAGTSWPTANTSNGSEVSKLEIQKSDDSVSFTNRNDI